MSSFFPTAARWVPCDYGGFAIPRAVWLQRIRPKRHGHCESTVKAPQSLPKALSNHHGHFQSTFKPPRSLSKHFQSTFKAPQSLSNHHGHFQSTFKPTRSLSKHFETTTVTFKALSKHSQSTTTVTFKALSNHGHFQSTFKATRQWGCIVCGETDSSDRLGKWFRGKRCHAEALPRRRINKVI